MKIEEAKKMLKAKLECLKNETSGINYDCNMRLCDGCSLNYEQGNMGEQKEALDFAIKALEQQPKTGHWIVHPSNKEQGERDFIWWKCSECGQVIYSETEKDRREYHAFCGRCGARMAESEDKE